MEMGVSGDGLSGDGSVCLVVVVGERGREG